MSKQRSSSRQIKLSKAFKVVDEETKRLAREQHLLLLERDNYNETEVFGLGNEEDDEYIDDEDNQSRKKKKIKTTVKPKDSKKSILTRPVRPLENILEANGIYPERVSNEPNYYLCASQPPKLQLKRPFCSICGYLGNYTCTRCGSRFCSIRCNESHKETKCLTMSM